MKKLIPFLSLLILISCGESSDSTGPNTNNILEDFSFTVDTVVVDPGEEIINLSQGLRLSGVTQDRKRIYLFNSIDQSMAVVDLDQLKMVDKLQFEKEGPNGVGEYISGFQLLEGERFVFTSFQSSGLFDREGEKILNLKFTPKEIEGLDSEDENPMTYEVLLNEDGSTHYSLPGNFFEGTRDFAVVDPVAKTGQMIDIPALDQAGEFRIVLQSGTSLMVYIEEVAIQKIQDQIFITSTFTSKVYRYDMDADSLQLFEFPHQLTAIEREAEITNMVSSQEEFDAERAKLADQVQYNKLLWDDQGERFYRFSQIRIPKVDEDLPTKYEVYFYAYDKDLNLLGETELEDLDKAPSYPFFKDGKLWSYVNVEDELGFAVFTFDF